MVANISIEELEELLKEVYDPENEHYAQYLSPHQFNERFAPSEADYQKLVRFARLNKLTVVSAPPNHTLLHVKASVADVERVFKVHMMQYRHPTEDRTFFSPDVEPTIEAGIKVLHITGFNNYAIPRSPLRDFHPIDSSVKPVANVGSAPGGLFTGKDIRPAYAAGIALTGSGQAVGLLQFDGYYPSDIQAYEADAGVPNVPIQNVFLNGFTGTPSTTGNGNLETSLDIEMVVAMAPNVSKIVVYGGSSVVDLLNEIDRSREILSWEEDWDDEGSPGFQEATWGKATEFLERHARLLLKKYGLLMPTPRILPGPGGSIDLHWETGRRELLINVRPDSNLAGFYGEATGTNSLKGKADLDASDLGLFTWLTATD